MYVAFAFGCECMMTKNVQYLGFNPIKTEGGRCQSMLHETKIWNTESKIEYQGIKNHLPPRLLPPTFPILPRHEPNAS